MIRESKRNGRITCPMCNRPFAFDAHYLDPLSPTVDHIHPKAKGGDQWAKDNLRLLCRKCNRAKSDTMPGATQAPTGVLLHPDGTMPTPGRPLIDANGTTFYERGPRGQLFRCFETSRTVV